MSPTPRLHTVTRRCLTCDWEDTVIHQDRSLALQATLAALEDHQAGDHPEPVTDGAH